MIATWLIFDAILALWIGPERAPPFFKEARARSSLIELGRLANADRDRFRRRHLAADGMVRERNQSVAFRLVADDAARRDVVGHDLEPVEAPFASVVDGGHELDPLARGEPERRDVGPVHQ